MKSSVAVKILHKTVPFFIKLSAVFQVFLYALGKIVFIDKIIPCIIGWVYVYEIYFAQICFLQQFQHFKVVTLNIKVLGLRKINAFLSAWTKRFIYGSIGKKHGFLFVRPGKLIPFLVAFDYFTGNLLHKHVLVNSAN